MTERADRVTAPAPVVVPPGGRRGWRTLARLAPVLLAPLVMVPLMLGSSAGPWRFAILALPVLAIGLWLLAERDPAGRRPPRPTAAELLLLTGSGDRAEGGPGDVLVLRRRSDPARGARRRRELRLEPGDAVGLVGPGAERQASWLLAQVLTHEPTATASVPPGWHLPPGRQPDQAGPAPGPRGHPWHVSVVRSRPDTRKPSTPGPGRHIVLAIAGDRAPAWCRHVLDVPIHDGVSRTWALRHAAGLEHSAADDGDLPSGVLLTDLLGPLTPASVRRRWAGSTGLRVPIGRDADGEVELDLVADGPHALVAGATGSGKSEALTAWLVGLAATRSPQDLTMILVDYKGGSAFTPLAPLPHVAAVLTDLEPAGTTRALASLGAELRRREHVLADAGVKDVADLHARGGRMPRLLVVVDEFRALADDQPQLLSDLVRLAAQGRSLGLHLVLATQRPSGIIGPDVRANVTVRLSLRVLEAADSRDVVGTPRAAELPAVPGRAVLRTSTTSEIQVAWLGPSADGGLADAVASIRSAASGAPPPPVPWAPELPSRLAQGGAHPGTSAPAAPTAVALLDEPDRLALTDWEWDGSALLVLGGPGTGRTTALRALGAGSAAAGRVVHVVGGADAVGAGEMTGTVAPPEDPRLGLRLLELLGAADSAPGQVLLVDDVELLLDRLDRSLGPGQSLAALPTAVRGVLGRGHHVALAGSPGSSSARWAEVGRSRLVLSPRDATEATLAGVDRSLAVGSGAPGRAVLVRPSGQRVAQVVDAPVLPPLSSAGGAGRRALPGADGHAGAVPLLRPLPRHAGHLPLTTGERAGTELVVGVGGDAATPVAVPLPSGGTIVVVGPPGAGRTTALGLLAARLEQAGARVHHGAEGPAGEVRAGDAVVLDDVDGFGHAELDAAAALPHRGVRVLASAGTQAVLTAHRPPLTTWAAGTVLVLRPDLALSARLVPGGLGTGADPLGASVPGRAAVVRGGRATTVQLIGPVAQEPRPAGVSGASGGAA
ncbi:MAG: FtsK/SpoIIIE domain-containing protein [Actinomycetaceae bacterium]